MNRRERAAGLEVATGKQGRRNCEGRAGEGAACPSPKYLVLSTAFREKKNFENWIKIDQNRGLPPQYFERSAGPAFKIEQ